MATQVQLITLIALSILGGVASAVLGWMDSGEPFNPRVFGASLIRAILGAAVSAMVFQGIDNVDVFVYLTAILTGAGFDVLGKRAQAALTPKSNTA
jgi:hypothetical protein